MEDRFKELQQKQERTEAEEKEFNEFINKYNQETNEYITKRAMDPVDVKEFTFDMDEYSEIMDVNSSNDVTINEQKIDAPDFLEVLYDLFVNNVTEADI
jgi:hypothetical protein